MLQGKSSGISASPRHQERLSQGALPPEHKPWHSTKQLKTHATGKEKAIYRGLSPHADCRSPKHSSRKKQIQCKAQRSRATKFTKKPLRKAADPGVDETEQSSRESSALSGAKAVLLLQWRFSPAAL